jgi:hypothetical protein
MEIDDMRTLIEPPDWLLRLTVIIHLLNEPCKCYVYTDGGTCVRCGQLSQAKTYWGAQYAQACETYTETTSGKGPK